MENLESNNLQNTKKSSFCIISRILALISLAVPIIILILFSVIPLLLSFIETPTCPSGDREIDCKGPGVMTFFSFVGMYTFTGFGFFIMAILEILSVIFLVIGKIKKEHTKKWISTVLIIGLNLVILLVYFGAYAPLVEASFRYFNQLIFSCQCLST